MIPSAPLGTDAAAGPHSLGAAGLVEAAAERRFRFELAAHPGSVAQARRLTRSRLTGWSIGEDTCDTAALVVSELVTNAIVHTASSHIVCELYDGGELVRIAVGDQGCPAGESGGPHPCGERAEEEHGRGLLLVDALCHAWGAHEHGPGLLVWADLHRTDAPEPRGDLGWGARPKPGPADGSGDEDDEAEARRHGLLPEPHHHDSTAEARHHGLAPAPGSPPETHPHGTLPGVHHHVSVPGTHLHCHGHVSEAHRHGALLEAHLHGIPPRRTGGSWL